MQRDIELAILHELDGLAEGQVFDLGEVLVGKSRRAEYGARIEFRAGLRSTHRDLLALEVGQGLDARVGARDDLDVIGIDRRDAAQFPEWCLEPGVLVSLPRIGQRVAERERHFAAAGLQQVQVLHRRLGRLDRRLDRGHGLADVVGQRDPERVIDAAGTTGEHVDELVGGERRDGEQKRKGERGDAAQKTIHASSG